MIIVERHVKAPPERLWEFVGDVSRWDELLPTVSSAVTKTGPAETGTGSRFALKQPGIPKMVYEVTEWVPGERFTWVAAFPGVRTVATHTIAATTDGCVLKLGLAWEGPISGVVTRLFKRRTDRYVQLEADTFANLAQQPT
ncbi:hypothetical protein BA895_21910 [Humibacillus sp. DSM 29435]|uniref:SRPBCC family protein n=1 Tax=Humibacillus sp. DSM 29435 TaxID=1869167 RepID=UPI00087259EC|nr:SRPBCC family protein [Humibacillus sp. DSM 29435]OFE15693.1 hypothetical protein BA895_21910 [Humibacillus sp. DSM 29435]